MKKILITGGAGFIGCNAAARFIRDGWSVTIFDNLSRPGAQLNLQWLGTLGPFELIRGDVRDADALRNAVAAGGKWEAVLHLAAQVAVTTSCVNPREDFEINALGTFNVLEAVRQSDSKPVVIFASTNKVYGSLDELEYGEDATRYTLPTLPHGVNESQPLDFHSPYGCSKGAADQYVRDYSRIFGLNTVVFRQSCIYGPRQFGVEDQGWLAHFMIAHSTGRAITIFGDGKQVRDILHVYDLVDGYVKAIQTRAAIGEVFNIGGGPGNTLSILEALQRIEAYSGHPVPRSSAEVRPGDQRVFICDISKASRLLGWTPKMDVTSGIESLREWVQEGQAVLAQTR